MKPELTKEQKENFSKELDILINQASLKWDKQYSITKNQLHLPSKIHLKLKNEYGDKFAILCNKYNLIPQ
jgi:hypothetical protein